VRRATPSTRAVIWWFVVAVLLAVTLWEAPGELRRLRSDVEGGSGRGRVYRELQPARSVGLHDTRPFLVAESVIPPDGRFAVVTGGSGAADAQARRWVRPFARYRMLPRRLVSTPREADWILSYGGDLDALGLRFRQVIAVRPGVAVAEVLRG
jgi:hypothetical protein